MKLHIHTVVCTAFAALALAGCGSKQQDSSQPDGAAVADATTHPTNDPDAQVSALLAAAEPFEGLTEQAPTADRAKLTTLVADAKKAASSVSGGLDPIQRQALANHISEIDAAAKANNPTDLALAAVEGYRTLVESASDTGPVPQAVSLLDYAGFRYQADLSAVPARWDDAGKALAFADERWAEIDAKVSDTALKAEFEKSLEAMRSAATAEDIAAAKKAVTRELDLVDTLEGYFAKK